MVNVRSYKKRDGTKVSSHLRSSSTRRRTLRKTTYKRKCLNCKEIIYQNICPHCGADQTEELSYNKGWKKWEHSKSDNIIWNNTKKGTVQVAFINEKQFWILTTWKSDETSRKDKYFKTKSEAIIQAKNYMKSHPRG